MSKFQILIFRKFDMFDFLFCRGVGGLNVKHVGHWLRRGAEQKLAKKELNQNWTTFLGTWHS